MDIAAILLNLKASADLIGLILQLSTDSKVTEKAIELQSKILALNNDLFALQSQNHSLLQEKHELEKQLIEIQNWQATASKYELIQPETGAFVYTLKPDQKTTAIPHWLCPNCYQQSKSSILYRIYSKIHHRNTFRCHPCGLEQVINSAMPA